MARTFYISLLTGLLFLVLPVVTFAGVNASLDLNPRLVKLGDSFQIVLEITSDGSERIQTPAFPQPVGLEYSGQVGSAHQVQISGGVTRVSDIFTASYTTTEEGNFDIGPIRINYSDGSGQHQIVTDIFTVEVYDDAPRPATGIIKGKLPSLLPWLITAALLAVLAALIYALITLRKKRKESPQSRPSILSQSPEAFALEQICALEIPDPEDEIALKDYYDKIDKIFRAYLAARYEVSTMDNTSWEIKTEFGRRQRMDNRVKGVLELINDCDWVKYAKTRPSRRVMERIVPRSREILR